MRKLFLLSLLTLACAPGAAQAAPIYADGNECPTDAQVAAAGYARQYYVIPSERCVFDVDSNNLQGTTGEADTYLNSADATAAGWGTAAPEDDWTGLGQAGGDSGNAIVGFSFTADPGNDDGTFTISGGLANSYNQFALAVKDGARPFWAIFELSVDQVTGDWGFSTNGGSLSHFALYARNTLDINEQCTNPDGCDPDITQVPEPATLLLLGSGLTYAARRKRAKR